MSVRFLVVLASVASLTGCLGEGDGRTSRRPANSEPQSTVPVDLQPHGSIIRVDERIEAEDFATTPRAVDSYFDTTAGNRGNVYRTTDVDVLTCTDSGGGYMLGYIANGEWTRYIVSVADAGSYRIEARVAAKSVQSFRMEIDGKSVQMSVPNTGAWQSFQTIVSEPVSLIAGEKVLKFVSQGSSFNINYFRVIRAGAAISSFTLINADTDQPIAGHDPLVNGATLNLATLPTRRLSIRGNGTGGIVASVRVELDGQARTENEQPWQLCGGSVTDYNPCTLAVGSHSLKMTPYSLIQLGGVAGTPGSIQFSVVDGGATTTTTTTMPPSGMAGPAELPRVYLSTSYPAPVGNTITVNAGGDLQAALNAAQPGDTVVLQAGATWTTTESFELPEKACTKARKTDCFITIRSSALSSLPPEGARVTPANAAAMPKIVTTSVATAIRTVGAAQYYRLIGLEIAARSTYINPQGLPEARTIVQLGDLSTTSVEGLPTDIIIDRCYIHGRAGQHTKRGIGLDSRSSSIIDSYISEIHGKGQDTQAIAGFNGPGPYKIVNNYLEGSGENIIFGGADPAIQNLVSSDIEIRRNHFYKPPSWKGVWLVKNIFELKNAQRVLVEGNIFDGSWADGQTGYALLYKSVDQVVSGPIPCPWCVVQDVTTRYNIIRNAGGAFSNTGQQGDPDIRTRKLMYQHNVVYDLNQGIYTGDTRHTSFMNGMSDVTFDHNTIVGQNMRAMLMMDISENWPEKSVTNLKYTNNVVVEGEYGVLGGGQYGVNALNLCAPNWVFAGNVIYGTQSGRWRYPAGNHYAVGEAGVGFANSSAKDFTLSSSSAYVGDATDGSNPGADIAAVRARTLGVISGRW